MAHEKYIKRGNKKYGPYIYETKRVNGRVVTTYLGKGKEFEKRKSKLTHNSGFDFRFYLVILLLAALFFSFFYLIEKQQIGLSPAIPEFALAHLNEFSISESSGDVNGIEFSLIEKKYGFVAGERGQTVLIVDFDTQVLLIGVAGLLPGATIDNVEILDEEEILEEEAPIGEKEPDASEKEVGEGASEDTEIGTDVPEEGTGTGADTEERGAGTEEGSTETGEGETGATGESVTGESDAGTGESGIGTETASESASEYPAPESSEPESTKAESTPEPSVEAAPSEVSPDGVQLSPLTEVSLNLGYDGETFEIRREGEIFRITYSIPTPTATVGITKNGLRVRIDSDIELDENILFYTQLPSSWNVDENDLKVINEDGESINFGIIDGYIKFMVPYQDAQIYEIIVITDALHLDSERNFISNIYKETRELDGIWSEEILNGEYVRVTFERNLTSERDITVYPRIVSGTPTIEVYEHNGAEIIAEFENLVNEEYNQILLTELEGEQDIFDLRIIGGSIEFDHIIDPLGGGSFEGGVDLFACGALDLENTVYVLQNNIDASQTCLTIRGNNITLEGQGFTITYGSSSAQVEQNGIISTFNETHIMNVKVRRGEFGTGSQPRNGIKFLGAENGSIKDVEAGGSRIGVYFDSSSNNNLTNLIANSNLLYGIVLHTNSKNNDLLNITANSNVFGGILIQADSNNNKLSDIKSRLNAKRGITLIIASNNSLQNSLIADSGENAILIGASANDNKFINVSILNTNTAFYDIKWNTEGIDDTHLVDMPHIGNYTFIGDGGTLIVENTNFGEIRFLESVNGSGINLTNDIRIGGNLAIVESSLNEGLNRSANVTLYNMPQNFLNPVILRDDLQCPAEICANFTSLNDETVIFNVSYWTNYSVGSQPEVPLTDCGTLSISGVTYILQNDVLSNENCFNVNANNITFDGQGFTITYGNVDSPNEFIGINSTFNQTEIRNVIIKKGTMAMFGQPRHGIKFSEVNNGIIKDVNASNNLIGISFNSSSNNNLSNIVTNYNIDFGISFDSSSNNNILNVTANSNSFYGISFVSSSNNNMTNITANSNAITGINFDSSSNNYLADINASSNFQSGIGLTNSNNNVLTGITTNLNSLSGIFLSSSFGNAITNLITDSNLVTGINFFSSSNNNFSDVISSNFQFGIDLSSSSDNILTNMTFNSNSVHGVVVQAGSNNNQFFNITSTSSGQRGVSIVNSLNNSFRAGMVAGSLKDAIFIGGSISDGNRFVNLSVSNTGATFNDIKWNTAGIDETHLINMPHIGSYSFAGLGGTLIVENDFGGVRFLQAVNGSGTNLTNDIRITQNLATVESLSNINLNRSANITLFNMPGGFLNPIILRDDLVCPIDICYNFTDLNEGTVIFNVSYWTNYSIGDFVIQLQIDISENLTAGIVWNITAPPVDDEPAEGNNGNLETYYFINVSAIGTNVDVYMRADGDLIYNDGINDYIIGLGNQTYTSSITDPTIAGGINLPITTDFADNLIGGDLPDGSTIYMKFFLDVPEGQRAGEYNNTIEFLAVPAGTPLG